MGKLLIILNYIFSVFSIDINEKRKHVHVFSKKRKKAKAAKFWLEPTIEATEKKGDFNDREIKEIVKLIEENRELLTKQLDLFYKGEKVKSINKNASTGKQTRKQQTKKNKEKPGN